MKWRLLFFALFFSPSLLFSQVLNSPSADVQSRGPVNQSTQTVSLAGNVEVEDGSAVAQQTTIVLDCSGTVRARTIVDRSGDFDLNLTIVDTTPGSMAQPAAPNSVSSQDWGTCELYSDQPGYVSEHIRLFGSPEIGMVRVGTLLLHPLATQPNNDFAVSVTSLEAPQKAKKAFEKGREQEKKGKWQAACDEFRKAVAVYPRYALAWLELGRSQMKQNDFTEAQQSFHRATEQDPHLIEGYVQMTKLAAEKKEWKELADATEHIIELSPDSVPNFWFLNSAANFNLGNMGQAENSATRGLRLDRDHRLPQLEYLYALILARRGNYKDAIPHMQNYLRLSPHASDAGDVQSKLAELQKLAASQKVATR
jgi:Tetratricopeptide repeat